MAKKRNASKANKKKPFGNDVSNVPRTMVDVGLGFPKKMLTKLKYNETITLNSTTGALANYQYRLNSINDTNATGAGGRPLYYNQFYGVYNHACVIGAKIQVKFISLEGNTVPMNVCLWQNDDTTIVPSLLTSMVEQGKAKRQLLGSAGVGVKTLTMGWSPKKTFGGSVLGNDQLRASAGSNPIETSVAVISVQSADPTSFVTTSCIAQVYVEYVVVFSELKDVVGS